MHTQLGAGLGKGLQIDWHFVLNGVLFLFLKFERGSSVEIHAYIELKYEAHEGSGRGTKP
jgi:hypothetical protein